MGINVKGRYDMLGPRVKVNGHTFYVTTEFSKGDYKPSKNSSPEALICLKCPTPDKECSGSCKYFIKEFNKIRYKSKK